MTRFTQTITSFVRLINHAFGQYRSSIAFLVCIGFLSGLFEGIGVNAIVPLLSFLSSGFSDASSEDFITRSMRVVFGFFGIPFSLKFLLAFVALLFILRAAVLLIGNLVKIRICAHYELEARERLFSAFLLADWPYLLQQRLGHLETNLMTNVRMSSLVLEHFSALIILFINLLIYLAVAFNISAAITAFTLLIGAISFFLLRPLLGSSKKFSLEIEALNKKIAHYLNENIIGMKTVKSLSVGSSVAQVAMRYFKELRNATIRIAGLRLIGDTVMQPLGVIFILLVFVFSYKTTMFQLGAFAAIIYLIQRIFIYFQQLQAGLRVVYEYAPYVQAVLALQEQTAVHREIDNGHDAFVFREILEFRHVNFTYDGRQSTLCDCHMTIRKGQTVGLIGPSGSGKTTIVDFILRLLRPESGSVLIDGKDVSFIKLDAWRRNIGYVSQDVFLMNDTIANNIRFYRPSVSDDDMMEAAREANIHEFILTLPMGYDTVVGERGMFLSAGQRQRIAIARALISRPQFLILDEATSALDNESELQVQRVIDGLKGKMTVMIIAHRLTTVLHVDTLYVLSDGRMIEEGRPEELLSRPNSYFYRAFYAKE